MTQEKMQWDKLLCRERQEDLIKQNNLKDELENISSKKHGFFQSEKEIFAEVASN
jgi:hypothetical protein